MTAPKTRNFQPNTSDNCLSVAASGRQSGQFLTSNAAAGDITINAGSTGLVVGGYVVVRSTALWPGTDKGAKMGEIARVKSKTSSTITFTTPLDDAYATADGATVERIIMGSGLTLEGIGFENLTSRPERAPAVTRWP